MGERSWSAIPLDWQVKGPCKACNEGWMEDLEAYVQPALVPMLQDQRVALGVKAQWGLSMWATLRVLVAQHGHEADARSIPERAYHRFYETRALPVGAQVWLGRYSGGGAWPTDYQHVELFASGPSRPEPPGPNAYVVAFSVGYVAFLYWGHDIEDGPVLDIGSDLGRFFVPIWPIARDGVEWPPPGLLGADGLEAAIRGLPIAF